MLAYDDITKIVAKLLFDNPRAQLFVTGHSLGGALAAVYGAMLHYNAETEITDRLAAIYTFGQPRVGDQNFANYANQKLKGHYNRVVYCNDIVPRVPFDNKLFQFKHFGGCHYYDNWYNGMVCTQYSSLAHFLGILSSRKRYKALYLPSNCCCTEKGKLREMLLWKKKSSLHLPPLLDTSTNWVVNLATKMLLTWNPSVGWFRSIEEALKPAR